MRVSIIVALLVAFVAGNTFGAAGDFLVYKTKNKISLYDQDTSKKPTKLTVETYTIFKKTKLQGSATADDPVRIVFLKLSKLNKDWSATNAEGKNTKKLYIDPTSFSYNADGTVKDYGPYENIDELDPYLPFAGPWSCEARQSSGTTAYQFILDFLDTEDAGGANAEKRGESYSGKMKTDKNYGTLANTLKGTLSYYTTGAANSGNWEIGIDSKGSLKLDKKLTAEVSGLSDSDSMNDAVQAVTAYLNGKKYASTWSLQ